MTFQDEASLNKVFAELPIKFKGKKINVDFALKKIGHANAQQHTERATTPLQEVAPTFANVPLPMSCQMLTVQLQQLVAELLHYLQHHSSYAPYNIPQDFYYSGQNFFNNNVSTTNYTMYDPSMAQIGHEYYSYTNGV